MPTHFCIACPERKAWCCICAGHRHYDPPSPEELVGALQDPIHPASGPLIRTTPIKKPEPEMRPESEMICDLCGGYCSTPPYHPWCEFPDWGDDY